MALRRTMKGGAKRVSSSSRTKATIARLDEPWLHFTVAQRNLIIDETMVEDHIIEKLKPVRIEGKLQPVRLSLKDWDDLGGYVFGAAEYHENERVRKKLARISKRIDRDILGDWGDEEDRYYIKDEEER